MTNLSSSKTNKGIINPENSLLFLPIIIGTVILTLLLTLIYKPLIKKLDNEKAQINVLNEKISYIPIYKKYIEDVSLIASRARKQQARLLDIISDPQELNTILSEINRISIDNDIEIINIVPKPIVKNTKSKDKPLTNTNSTSTSTLIQDPFLLDSIEKHIFKLTLKGEFNKLLDFLKELELIQSIAITDNIKIKATPINDKKEKLRLIMSFDLSTYAKITINKLNNIP